MWLQGLAALLANDAVSAVSAFNAVYGQLPGELAPKLALARACELSGETAVAQRMYSLCARSDAAYVAPAQFGIARIAAAAGQRAEALGALERIPATSRAYGDARRQRAVLLAATIDDAHAFADLAEAAVELDQAAMEPRSRSDLRIQILGSALALVRRRGPNPKALIAGAAADEPSLRRAMEQAYRDAARLSDDPRDGCGWSTRPTTSGRARWCEVPLSNDPQVPEPPPSAGVGAVDGPLRCPSCDALVTADDAFCESCGATLQAGALPAAPGAPARTDPSPTASVPPSPSSSAAADAPTVTTSTIARRCAACGGEVLDDGFCGTCGQRALSERDHWSEHPAPWLGGLCDKGIVHARNEDAMALAATPDGHLGILVVCDGVTTAPNSDRAALAAARAACAHLLAASPGAAPDEPEAGVIDRSSTAVADAAAQANAAAVGVARTLGNPKEPPSCTFVAAVVAGDVLTVAWCGDSRAYWLPDDAAGEQLTVDHSLGTEMVASGMSRGEAEADPTSHTITRWLGADSYDPRPEVVSRHLDGAGWVLVCTDGLWNYASTPEALAELVAAALGDAATAPDDPLVVADHLVAWANEQGGHDNITAALARYDPSVR